MRAPEPGLGIWCLSALLVGCFGPPLEVDPNDPNGGSGSGSGRGGPSGPPRGGETPDDSGSPPTGGSTPGGTATPGPTPSPGATPVLPGEGINAAQIIGLDAAMDEADDWNAWCDENVPPGMRPEPRRGGTMAFFDFWSYPGDSPARTRFVLFGGRTVRVDPETGERRSFLLNDTWFYYPRCGRWKPVPGTQGGGPLPREGHVMVNASGMILVIGGRTTSQLSGTTLLLSDVWALNLAEYNGSDGEGGFHWNQMTPSGPEPRGRWGHTAVVDQRWLGEGNAENRNRVLIFGGNMQVRQGGGGSDDRNEQTVNEMWELNVRNILMPEWREITGEVGQLPVARRGAAGALYSLQPMDAPQIRKWLVFGGIDGPQDDLNNDGRADGRVRGDAWFFDLNAGLWSQVDAEGALPTPRYGAAAEYELNGGRLIIMGGHGDDQMGPRNDMYEIGLRFGTGWKRLVAGDLGVEFPVGTLPERRAFGAIVVDGWTGMPYLFGGEGDCGPLDDLWRLNINLNPAVWELRQPATTGLTCVRLGVCPDRGDICELPPQPWLETQ